ncbi:MAG: Ig-like domain-containing protein [Candidatus Zixiibacteriota bacterium]
MLIKGDGTDPAVIRTATMTGDATKELGTANAFIAQAITSLDAAGFTVGSDPTTNASGTAYYWIAFKSSPGEMAIGSYIGDQQDDRSITGIGFHPAYVIVFAEADEQVMQRFADEPPDESLELQGSQKGNRIQDFQPDGFQIGDDNTVNKQVVVYHYIAWNSVYGAAGGASYIGNETQNRNVGGVGFQPDAVIIKNANGESGVFRLASFTSDSSLFLDAQAGLERGIESFRPDGFQVGTHKAVNEKDETIYWVAFKDRPGADLELTTSLSVPLTYVGDTIACTVLVTNHGPEPATGVRVTDLLPGGLEYLSHSVSSGGYVSASGNWTLGNLAQSGTASLAITCRVLDDTVGSTITNCANITALNQSDPDTANNHACASTTIAGRPPVIAPIDPKTIAVGQTLVFDVVAIDPDSTIPALAAEGVPPNASFQSNGDGTGTFQFTPDLLQLGTHSVLFVASDGALADSQVATIDVVLLNLPPVLSPIGAQSVDEGQHLQFNVSATDLNGDVPTLSCLGLPTNAAFTDSGNGSGRFTFDPDYTQAGLYGVSVIASDGSLADTELVSITVVNVNRPPSLAAIGAKSVSEGQNLNFIVAASDPDGTYPELRAGNPPANAQFTDAGNGTGTFLFNPDYTQAGVYTVRFVASDGFLADTEMVAITVVDVNRPPVLASIGAKSVAKNENLTIAVTATDSDSTKPTLSAAPLPLHATFLDQGNGSGTFQFEPDESQVGVYFVTFVATDGALADSETVKITVTDINLSPVIDPIQDTSVLEGQTLTLTVTATDPEGTLPIWSLVGAPPQATFETLADGRGRFVFSPSFIQAGIYVVVFIASDGSLADSASVVVTVIEAGNQRPAVDVTGPRVVLLGESLELSIFGTDPDSTVPSLGIIALPANATFTDHHNGQGIFAFTPSSAQLGEHQLLFTASDGASADTEIVSVSVVADLPAQIVVSPDSVVVSADSTLQFTVAAYDINGNPADPGSVSWSLTAPLGTISATGLFDAVVAGQAQVIATSSLGFADTTQWLQVVPGRTVALRVLPDSLDVWVGDTARYAAEGSDRNGNVTTIGPLHWGVLGAVGSIDGSGLFVATTPGSGRIWARSETGDLADTSRILLVLANALDRLVVQPDTASLKISDARVFTATGFNRKWEPVDVGELTWSVAGDIGHIDADGRFVATKPGIGYIVATSSINGVMDTSNMIVVDVLTVSAIRLGNEYVSAGQSLVPILAFTIENRFDTPRGLTGITVRNASRGKGSASQVRGNISAISLYEDTDRDELLTPDDEIIGTTPFSADAVSFALSSVPVAPGSDLSLFAAISVASAPRDSDSLDLFLSPQTDIRTVDGSTVAGSATINSIGYGIVDGLVARQVHLIAPSSDIIAPQSYASVVLTIDLPRNGYMIDTLEILTLSNLGTATPQDIDSVILYAEERVGPLEFTGGLWSISGLHVPLIGPTRRFQVAVELSPAARQGATISLGIPLHGIEVASGNDGPIDAAVPPAATVTIVAQHAVAVADIPLPTRALIPGTTSGSILSISLVNHTGSTATLDSLRLTLYAADPGTAPQSLLDSQIDAVWLWLDRDGDSSSLGPVDSVIASGTVQDGSTLLTTPALSIPGDGSRVTLALAVDVSRWSSKNGNTINCGIADADELYFHQSLSVNGIFPLKNSGDFTVDAFPAANVIVDTLTDVTLLEGQQDRVLFRFRLPRNGYREDVLRGLRVACEGAIEARTVFTDVRLWQDKGTAGKDGSDVSLGALAYQSGAWSITSLSCPLQDTTTPFLITADVSASVTGGGTVQFLIQVDGVTYGSGTDGPDDDAVRSPSTLLMLPANRMTAISIPSTSMPITPGSARNILFSFALYNGYAGTSQMLRGITLTNISRSRSGLAFADQELGQVSLFTDGNADRVFNEVTPIGTGYFASGQMRLSGTEQVLAPQSLNYFFVVADVPLNLIDSDSLALSINGTADFEFREAVSVNGDIPVHGGSYRVVDGSVAAQYELIDLIPVTMRPGDSSVSLLGFRPAANGDRTDTLTSLVISNLGTAGPGDISDLRLYLDRDVSHSMTPADSLLGRFSPVGNDWRVDLSGLDVGPSPPVLIVVADVPDTATQGRTLRLTIPVNGCTYASANDGPNDLALAGVRTGTITGGALSVSPSMARTTYSVGQGVCLNIDISNTLSSVLYDVTPQVVGILDSSAVSLDSSDVAPRALAAGETTRFHLYYTARHPGHPAWRLRAAARDLTDSSAIVETNPVTVKTVPSSVGIRFVNTMPTAAIRGQEHVYPLSILISDSDTSALVSSLRLDSIRIHVEDATGHPMAASDIATRLVLSSGYTDIAVIDQVPQESSVLLAFAAPVIVAPGESRLVTLLVDISDSARAQSFSLELQNEQSLVPADENTLLPVSYRPEPGFPWKTAGCRIYQPATTAAVSGFGLQKEIADYGQSDVPVLRVTARHPDLVGSSQIQLSRVKCVFVDSAGAMIAPGDVADRVSVVSRRTVVGELTSIPSILDAAEVALQAPITFSAGQTDSIDVWISVRPDASRSEFEVLIADSAALTFRDLSSGSLLTAIPDPLVIRQESMFPIRSGVLALKHRAEPPVICVSSRLPSAVTGGADSVPLANLTLVHPSPVDHAPVLLRNARVLALDSTWRVLDPYRLFDRIGYRIGEGAIVYLPQFTLSQGAIRIGIGDPGLSLSPGDSTTIELIADINADVPYDHFLVSLSGDNGIDVVDAADTASYLRPTTGEGCPGSLPFVSPLTRIFFPAGSPRLYVDETRGQVTAPGQAGVSLLRGRLQYSPPALQGNLELTSLRGRLYRRLPESLTAVDAGVILDSAVLTVGQDRSAAVELSSGELSFGFEPGVVIRHGDNLDVSIIATVRASVPLGNYLFQVQDSLWIGLADEQLGTPIAPILGTGGYPCVLGELSVTSPGLKESFTNFPNPFNPAHGEITTIGYVLKERADVDLTIFTITGEEVRTILQRASRDAGSHQTEVWDGLNGSGQMVLPGAYYCRITVKYTSGESAHFKRKVAVVR